MTAYRHRRGSAGAWSAAAVAAAAVVAGGGATAPAQAQVPAVSLPGCPALLVIGVQGTGQSTPAADPGVDSGMLGTMFAPMLGAGVGIDRVYIGYPASFGGAPGTGPGTATYAASSGYARDRLNATASEAIVACPGTQLAVAGFSQGAGVVSEFAHDVGTGDGPVPADRVAGIALVSDPARPAGGEPLPGRPGQRSPDPAPGTDGAAVAGIRLGPVPGTGGIADTGVVFEDLQGRVAEFCAPGDLACDAPPNAAALQVAAGVAARSDLRDPLTAAASITATVQATVADAAARVLVEDVSVTDGQVNYVPGEAVSQRLADAADPGYDPGRGSRHAAAERCAQVIGAIAADPVSQIPRLAGQIGAVIGAELAANADLLDPATLARYGSVIGAHTGYGATGDTGTAADWFAALSHDLTDSGPR